MSEASVWEAQFEQPEVLEWKEEDKDIISQELSEDLISLLNLGDLKYEIEVRGHKIVLRTLRMSEELEIGLFIKPYIGTLDEGRAIATATVAASIESYDGKSLITAIGPYENVLRKKFDFIKDKMYWPVIQIIYEEGYIPLVKKQVETIEEFRKK